MSTLQERLEAALRHGKKTRQDLINEKITSRQAVNKWFDDPKSKNLKMEHLFAVADFCKVDARWLATGRDAKPVPPGKADAPSQFSDIPQRRIDLIRMYGRLPDEVRFPIRQLIETLHGLQHPRREEYVKRAKRPPAMVHE